MKRTKKKKISVLETQKLARKLDSTRIKHNKRLGSKRPYLKQTDLYLMFYEYLTSDLGLVITDPFGEVIEKLVPKDDHELIARGTKYPVYTKINYEKFVFHEKKKSKKVMEPLRDFAKYRAKGSMDPRKYKR